MKTNPQLTIYMQYMKQGFIYVVYKWNGEQIESMEELNIFMSKVPNKIFVDNSRKKPLQVVDEIKLRQVSTYIHIVILNRSTERCQESRKSSPSNKCQVRVKFAVQHSSQYSSTPPKEIQKLLSTKRYPKPDPSRYNLRTYLRRIYYFQTKQMDRHRMQTDTDLLQTQ
ncbi:Hypothetical_protein [Hexamita inflata]|uniref:Hypothetical_protein n=1 Tax=Hexamita inflata TaxID=28002 RepID=A0AA86R2Y1_9EUKA|nr:Hypothetical protein HINF_LOCUS52449 [Hexamita inflata]